MAGFADLEGGVLQAELAQLAFRKAGFPGVMTRFRLTELSGVTKGAQAGARVAILKRADPAPTTSRDPADAEGWAARRLACQDALEAVAKSRASAEATTFAKAYAAILAEEPALFAAVI
ncbi:MAG TPA: hypothetical protein VGI95_05845 [Caulobacteraceae bacterium]|jgi:hypothetical protein